MHGGLPGEANKVTKCLQNPWVHWALIILAILLSCAEVAIPYFQDAIPKGVFAALSVVVTGAAWFVRVKVEKEILDDGRQTD
jgi:hypothetical protein